MSNSSEVLALRSLVRKLAGQIADQDRRLAAVERPSAARYRSIEGGTQTVYDDAGSPRVSLGVQPDGSYTKVESNAPAPAQPSAPGVEERAGMLVITWDGATETGDAWLADFERVEVHVSTTSGFVPTNDTQVTEFTTTKGGTVSLALDTVEHYVVLVSANRSQTESGPSLEVSGTPLAVQTGAGGIKTYYAPTEPAGLTADDDGALWYDESNGNRVSRWDGDLLDWILILIGAGSFENGAVTEQAIASGAVTSEQLALAAVLAANLANDSVTAAKILDGNITTPKIGTGQVISTKLASGAVVESKLGTGAITETKLADDAITTPKIATGAVTADAIFANAVTANAIAAGAIAAGHIQADAIVADKIATDAVTADAILADAITANEIATGAIEADHIQTDAIIAGKIAAGAVTATKIGANAVTAAKLHADAITGKTITGGTVTGAVVRSDDPTTDGVQVIMRETTAVAEGFKAGILEFDPNESGVLPGSLYGYRSSGSDGEIDRVVVLRPLRRNSLGVEVALSEFENTTTGALSTLARVSADEVRASGADKFIADVDNKARITSDLTRTKISSPNLASYVDITDSGVTIVGQADKAASYVYLNGAGQTIPTITNTLFNPDTIWYVDGIAWSGANDEFTIPSAGNYMAVACAPWTGGSVGTRRTLQILKNGIEVAYAETAGGANANNTPTSTATVPLLCAAGDKLKMQLFHNGGSGVQVVGLGRAYFAVSKM